MIEVLIALLGLALVFPFIKIYFNGGVAIN